MNKMDPNSTISEPTKHTMHQLSHALLRAPLPTFYRRHHPTPFTNNLAQRQHRTVSRNLCHLSNYRDKPTQHALDVLFQRFRVS
jgi:hypothetical protein